MRLVITPGGPLPQVTDQAVAGELKLGDTDSRALDLSLAETRHLDIRDKICLPNVLHAQLVALLPDVEKIGAPGIAIGKFIWAIKQEVLTVNYIHHQGGISHC